MPNKRILSLLARLLAVLCLFTLSAHGQAGDFAPSQTASNPLQLRISDGSIGGGVLGTFQFKATNVLLTASATNYVYLDLTTSPPTLTVNTTGFPATAVCYKIATVVTSAAQITSLTDSRPSFNSTLGSSSSSPSSQGPVINVTNSIYAGGALSSNADNNAQFTSAVAALNASTNPSISTALGTPVLASGVTPGATTLNWSATVPANATTIMFIGDQSSHHAMTASDTGGTIYSQVSGAQSLVAAGSMTVHASAPGGMKSSTGFGLQWSGSQPNAVVSISYPSGVSLVTNPIGASSGGAGTAFTFSQTMLRAGSTLAVGCVFFNSNAATFSATTGTVQTQVASTATVQGVVLMTNTGTSIGSNVTVAGNFSAATNTACVGIEIQTYGTSTQLPTLYVPAGSYNYSGGLNPTIPALLKCEPGAVLNYTGSGHAVDMGPIGGSPASLPTWPYYVDGCTFSGGQNATQGVFFQPNTVIVGVRNSTFVNFGPASTGVNGFYAVAGQCDQWDEEIGPQNRFLTTDLIPRNYVRNNIGACDMDSFLRVHDSEFYCLAGPGGANAINCNAGQSGIGIYADGLQHIISLNSFGWLNPDIIMACANATFCYGSKIDNNVIDSQQDCTVPIGGTCYSPITFRNTIQGLVVQHNNFDLHSLAKSPIGPYDGSALLNGLRVNFNQASPIADATPFVTMNNTAGQILNQSSNNFCNTATGTGGVWKNCVTPHTTGANINNFTFNVDDQHTAGLYATTTNCSAVGSAASPSVAACVAAASGSFSCATAATATCTVNTTAVTANSNIIVQQRTDTTTGTRLGVTCNVTLSTIRPDITAVVAATSFSFGLTQPVTNPNCYAYWIVN